LKAGQNKETRFQTVILNGVSVEILWETANYFSSKKPTLTSSGVVLTLRFHLVCLLYGVNPATRFL
jgi:hypothetical protein